MVAAQVEGCPPSVECRARQISHKIIIVDNSVVIDLPPFCRLHRSRYGQGNVILPVEVNVGGNNRRISFGLHYVNHRRRRTRIAKARAELAFERVRQFEVIARFRP